MGAARDRETSAARWGRLAAAREPAADLSPGGRTSLDETYCTEAISPVSGCAGEHVPRI